MEFQMKKGHNCDKNLDGVIHLFLSADGSNVYMMVEKYWQIQSIHSNGYKKWVGVRSMVTC